MKNRWNAAASTLVLALLFCLGSPSTEAVEIDHYGEPLTGADMVKVSELLSNPEPYLGKKVRVVGLVTGVCAKRGCWISIADDEEFKEIRVKVDDGVIVFPMEAKGRRATAEGVFVKIEMTMEQTLKYLEHHAEEHGEEFDPSEVTEPKVFYQIKGEGAVIRKL